MTIAVLAASSLAVAGCGDDGKPSTSSTGTQAEAPTPRVITDRKEDLKGDPAPRARGKVVKIGPTDHGRVLVDAVGKPLYLFTRDKMGPSRCYGECAVAWPPLLTKGAPRAGAGARAALLGTTKRSDGALQVTYRGQPLYYYRGDTPGVVRCQGVDEFGGVWYILGAGGVAIRTGGE